jgi:hypothetical protein
MSMLNFILKMFRNRTSSVPNHVVQFKCKLMSRCWSFMALHRLILKVLTTVSEDSAASIFTSSSKMKAVSSNMSLFWRGIYEGASKSFRTGRLERELEMVQLSTTRCICIAILWIRLMSFAAITIYVASQWVFIVVSLYFVIDSVWKLLDTPLYDFLFVSFKGEI